MEIQGWDAWVEKYRPIKNTIKPSNDLMFETYGAEVEFVREQDPRYVWTYVDGDMSSLLVAGYAYVNRLGYYVTEVPWENDMDYVLLSEEKECACYDGEAWDSGDREEAGDPDCEMCQGYGLVTEYVG
jgi:hypothetical protein